MMKEIFIDAVKKYNGCSGDDSTVLYAYNLICTLSDTAGTEGLIAFYDRALVEAKVDSDNMDKLRYKDIHYGLEGLDRLIAAMAELVVNGTEPELIAEIAAERYFISDFNGTDALAAYIIIKGFMMIQRGESRERLEQHLKPLLPASIEDRVIEKRWNISRKAGNTAKDKIHSTCTAHPVPIETNSIINIGEYTGNKAYGTNCLTCASTSCDNWLDMPMCTSIMSEYYGQIVTKEGKCAHYIKSK